MPFDMSPEDVETVTKPEVFSLEGLIAWLETRPAHDSYDWDSVTECLACRYHEAMTGFRHVRGRRYHSAFGGMDNYLLVASEKPWTYGAALSRARALLAKP